MHVFIVIYHLWFGMTGYICLWIIHDFENDVKNHLNMRIFSLRCCVVTFYNKPRLGVVVMLACTRRHWDRCWTLYCIVLKMQSTVERFSKQYRLFHRVNTETVSFWKCALSSVAAMFTKARHSSVSKYFNPNSFAALVWRTWNSILLYSQGDPVFNLFSVSAFFRLFISAPRKCSVSSIKGVQS